MWKTRGWISGATRERQACAETSAMDNRAAYGHAYMRAITILWNPSPDFRQDATGNNHLSERVRSGYARPVATVVSESLEPGSYSYS